jgi:hypothetical protein
MRRDAPIRDAFGGRGLERAVDRRALRVLVLATREEIGERLLRERALAAVIATVVAL